MTRAEVASLVALLAGAYPMATIGQGTVEAWTLLLAGHDAERIRRAAQRHILTAKWFPTIAELVGGASEESLALPDTTTGVGQILSLVHSTSKRRPIGNPIAEAVIDAVGWEYLQDSENPEALRAQLRTHYERYRARALEAGSLEAAGLLPPAPCEPVARRMGEARSMRELLPDVLKSSPNPKAAAPMEPKR